MSATVRYRLCNTVRPGNASASTGAQRRAPLSQDIIRIGPYNERARERIQSPRVTAKVFARGSNSGSPHFSSLLYTSSVYPGQAPVWPRTPLWAFAIGPAGNRKHRRFNGRAPARIISAGGSLGGQSDRCSRCPLPSPDCGSTVASSWSLLMLNVRMPAMVTGPSGAMASPMVVNMAAQEPRRFCSTVVPGPSPMTAAIRFLRAIRISCGQVQVIVG